MGKQKRSRRAGPGSQRRQSSEGTHQGCRTPRPGPCREGPATPSAATSGSRSCRRTRTPPGCATCARGHPVRPQVNQPELTVRRHRSATIHPSAISGPDFTPAPVADPNADWSHDAYDTRRCKHATCKLVTWHRSDRRRYIKLTQTEQDVTAVKQ